MNLFPKWLQGKGEQTFYTGTVTGRGGTLPLPSIAAGSRAEALAKAKELVRRSGGNPSQLTFELKPFTGLAGLAGREGARRINQKDYTHYVISVRDNAIESGWSFVEDAEEHIRENLPPGVAAKVFTKRGAVRAGLDPDDDANWMRGGLGGLGGRNPDDYDETWGEENADARPDIQDDDYVLRDGRGGGYALSIEGKHSHPHLLFKGMEWADVMEKIRKLMDQDKFYPNVWYVNERGNTDLIDPTDGKIIQSWV